MPQIYCSGCKKSTPHKVVMRRCKSQTATLTAQLSQLAQLVGKFVSGDHYYDMEPQHYCRCCNQKANGAKTSKRELSTVVAQHL